MTLGDAFPSGFAEAAIRRQLRPGVVIKIRAVLDDGEEREKRFVVVKVDDTTVACVINSEINAIISRNEALARCQVSISASEEFADRDCHADCSRLRYFSTEDVIAQLMADKTWVLGQIGTDLRDQLMAAIKASPVIPPAEAARVIEALGAAG